MADTQTSTTLRNEYLIPRKLEDFFSETWRIYKNHYGTLWGITAILAIFHVLFMESRRFSGFLVDIMSERGGITAHLPAFIVGLFLVFALFMIVSIWAQCALTYVVIAQYAGREVVFTMAFGQKTWGRLGMVILTVMVEGLVIGALSVTIIGIPVAIYLAISWAFVIPVIILEHTGVFEALSRSYNLIKGNWWRICGLILLFGLIASGIHLVVGMVPYMGSFIATVIAAPINALVSVLLYLDLRIRKEGFSLDTFVQELDRNVHSA